MGRTKVFRKQPGHWMGWSHDSDHCSVSRHEFANIDKDLHPK